jgi:hypothetical protein
MRHKRLYVGMLLVGLPLFAQAGGTAIELRATIMQVQCNAEQRTRVRACAKPQETLGTESYKAIEVVGRGDSGRAIADSRFEIRVDTTRQVLVRTLLY